MRFNHRQQVSTLSTFDVSLRVYEYVRRQIWRTIDDGLQFEANPTRKPRQRASGDGQIVISFLSEEILKALLMGLL